MPSSASLGPTTPARARGRRRPWRPSLLTWIIALIALIALGGMGTFLYPSVAAWLSSYNQAALLDGYEDQVARAAPPRATQLDQAREYNDALLAGVDVRANTNIATGQGVLMDESLVYQDILSVNEAGLMGRVKIPGIDVDLPIYHGTSDEVLALGAGHLEGSHLPVGGRGTHAVITAHRGLAEAEMFTHLSDVVEGDTFTVDVFGETLTYRVREVKVVLPEDTDTLRPVADRDMVTLITCTPLGINTHRILVTGERVPDASVQPEMVREVDVPGFPWWIVWIGLTVLVVGLYLWRSGYSDARTARAPGLRPEGAVERSGEDQA